jgi:hypothetical protein
MDEITFKNGQVAQANSDGYADADRCLTPERSDASHHLRQLLAADGGAGESCVAPAAQL